MGVRPRSGKVHAPAVRRGARDGNGGVPEGARGSKSAESTSGNLRRGEAVSGTRRALLLGSPTGGLEGVENDVDGMKRTLEALHFATTTLVGAPATREGNLTAYQRLIVDARRGDTVCVYYSGHGGRVQNPYRIGPKSGIGPPFLQYILPSDHGPGSFRGVMSFELSGLLS